MLIHERPLLRAARLLYVLRLALTGADLPVHCLQPEVAGGWTFFLGASEPRETPPPCGHEAPDRNADHLEQPPEKLLAASSAAERVELELRSPDSAWRLHDSGTLSRAGHWTMVYDEGFEVTLDARVFFAFSAYQSRNSASSIESDMFSGNDDSAAYESLCSRTLLGWYREPDPDALGSHRWGCYRGEQHWKEARPGMPVPAVSTAALAPVATSRSQKPPHAVAPNALATAATAATAAAVAAATAATAPHPTSPSADTAAASAREGLGLTVAAASYDPSAVAKLAAAEAAAEAREVDAMGSSAGDGGASGVALHAALAARAANIPAPAAAGTPAASAEAAAAFALRSAIAGDTRPAASLWTAGAASPHATADVIATPLLTLHRPWRSRLVIAPNVLLKARTSEADSSWDGVSEPNGAVGGGSIDGGSVDNSLLRYSSSLLRTAANTSIAVVRSRPDSNSVAAARQREVGAGSRGDTHRHRRRRRRRRRRRAKQGAAASSSSQQPTTPLNGRLAPSWLELSASSWTLQQMQEWVAAINRGETLGDATPGKARDGDQGDRGGVGGSHRKVRRSWRARAYPQFADRPLSELQILAGGYLHHPPPHYPQPPRGEAADDNQWRGAATDERGQAEGQPSAQKMALDADVAPEMSLMQILEAQPATGAGAEAKAVAETEKRLGEQLIEYVKGVDSGDSGDEEEVGGSDDEEDDAHDGDDGEGGDELGKIGRVIGSITGNAVKAAGGSGSGGKHAGGEAAGDTAAASERVRSRRSREDVSDLPRSLDWRRIDGTNWDKGARRYQGLCGSCYAIAAVEMLEARVRVRSNGTLPTPRLSVASITQCSRYNQGCDGGYPYLAMKHGQDVGVALTDCVPDTPGSDNALRRKQCDLDAACAVRVSSYGYVGGYYGGGTERAMMEALLGGPIVTSFYVPGDFMMYGEGVYHAEDRADGDMDGPGLRAPSSLYADGVQPWRKTAHSVLLVGWGEEPPNEGAGSYDEHGGYVAAIGPERYWICRNSWGKEWGEAGYFRIRRGTDECAVESMAVVAEPDMGSPALDRGSATAAATATATIATASSARPRTFAPVGAAAAAAAAFNATVPVARQAIAIAAATVSAGTPSPRVRARKGAGDGNALLPEQLPPNALAQPAATSARPAATAAQPATTAPATMPANPTPLPFIEELVPGQAGAAEAAEARGDFSNGEDRESVKAAEAAETANGDVSPAGSAMVPGAIDETLTASLPVGESRADSGAGDGPVTDDPMPPENNEKFGWSWGG